MALTDYRKEKLHTRKALLASGVHPYPENVKRTHTAGEAHMNFDALVKAQKEIELAGRIMSMRGHGGATFGDVHDTSGKMQFFVARDKMGATAYDNFAHTFDVGDFAELRGTLFITKRGEQTLEVHSAKLLAKSLRPIPEKWHGLQDVEERFRKRYLDLLMSEEVRAKFAMRSAIVDAMRRFFIDEGFLEVETPILQTIPGGASARPFKTRLNALKLDMYLRVAPELYLKRLLVGGVERVFEMARCFRNEGMDASHNPEFTQVEAYWAYANYKDMMKLVERLVLAAVEATDKGRVPLEAANAARRSVSRGITYEGKKINFKAPWPRIEFTTFLRQHTGIDYETLNRTALAKEAKKLGLAPDTHATKAQIADEIIKKACLPKVQDPIFVIHTPAELTPLAKPLEDKPQYAARFQLFVAGWEVANAFSELNDPVLQRERFEEQEKQRKAGNEEAQRLDEDFLEALEYGMPPAAGLGLGIDRLAAILTDSHTLREAILFPMMKPKK